MWVVQAAGEAEGLEAGVGVLDDVAPGVVVQLLHHGAVGGVDDEPWAAQVVGDDAVGLAAFDYVRRDVAFVGVDESCHYLVAAVQFGDGAQAVLVEEALGERAVELFADPAVFAVDEVVDLGAVGQAGVLQITENGAFSIRRNTRRTAIDALQRNPPYTGYAGMRVTSYIGIRLTRVQKINLSPFSCEVPDPEVPQAVFRRYFRTGTNGGWLILEYGEIIQADNGDTVVCGGGRLGKRQDLPLTFVCLSGRVPSRGLTSHSSTRFPGRGIHFFKRNKPGPP
jgi:hypothetical protein